MANEYDVLERKPTEIDLADVAKVSGGNWKRLLTYLGVPYDQTATFLVSSSQNVHDACFEGLMYWRKGNAVVDEEPSPVTYSKLLNSMEDADMKSTAEEMKKNIVKRYKPIVKALQPSSGGEPSSNVILDERSKKIKQVVQGYRNGEDISLPNDPELEGKYDSVMSELKVHLSAAKPKTLKRIHALFCNVYRRMQFGVKPVDMPHIPEEGPGLYKFLEDKFTPYELFLLHDAFKEMNNAKLHTKFTEYESVLSTQLMEKLTSCAARNISLPKYDNHTHMAIAVSREQVLIALIIHLKEYFSAYLDLKEALFEGFQEGCTVLYFAITTTDAVLLAPRVLSHLAELKRRFSVTHIIVFGHFVADVDHGTIEPLAAHDRRQVVAVFEKVQQELISTKKKLDVVEEGFVEAEKMLRTSTVSWSEDKFNASPLGTEPVLQIKDLKEEILHQFEQLQTSKVNEDVMKYEHLQNKAIALEMKLKEEEMLRKKAEEEQRRITGELVKMEKKWSESGSKSNAIPKKVISDVEGLLGQSSESVEGLQDKSKMLLEEWSKISEHERSLQLSGGGTTECEDELFALAYEDGVKDKYMCHVYEKTEGHMSYHEGNAIWMEATAQLHMVITYSTSHWSQIVQKYCMPDGYHWKLHTVIQDFTVEGDVITPHIPESSGPTWSCAIDGIDKVPTSSLDFIKRFLPEKDGPKLLEQAVKSSFYPPKINLIVSSDVHPRTEYNRSRLICLELAGSSPGFQIPVKIMYKVEPEVREAKKISELHSDREAHEKESFSEEDVLSPSMKTHMLPSPSVQESGMTKAPLKTKAATILSAFSKEKDQQAN